MRYIPIGSPVTGRRHGLVLTTPTATPGSQCTSLGSLSVGRATAVPVQPATNLVVAQQAAMAAAAALWSSLSAPQQALWNSYPVLGALGYNNFVGFNTLQFQWGLDPFIAPPGLHTFSAVGLWFFYPEPDGIHTTLVAFANGTNPTGYETWLRLYTNGRAPGTIACSEEITPNGSVNFLGSYGPLNNVTASFFDVTDALAALFIVWRPLLCIDTTSETECGGNPGWSAFYSTDQFGRPASNYLPEQYGPISPSVVGAIGAGVCPLPNSPPYPWPTAVARYG